MFSRCFRLAAGKDEKERNTVLWESTKRIFNGTSYVELETKTITFLTISIHKQNGSTKAHTNTHSCERVIFLKTLPLTATALLPIIAEHDLTAVKTWQDEDLMKNSMKDFPATLTTPKSVQYHIRQKKFQATRQGNF